MEKRTPLPAGTEIEYCDMPAVVVQDDGGSTLRVACDGFEQTWRWSFEGVSCTVVKYPENIEPEPRRSA